MDLAIVFGSLIVFWAMTRLSRREMGLRWGAGRYHRIAVVYPVAAMAVLAAVALLSGHAVLAEAFTTKTAGRLALMFGATLAGALITEEGFFRGWLWGSVERSGVSAKGALIWTSIVFMLWHVPTATMQADYKPEPALVPIYLANVVLLGMIWGIMRAASGSILVPTVSHAVWNAFAYVYYGYGPKTAALDISWVGMFDPERGVLGLIVNSIALLFFWRWWKRSAMEPPA
jgi:membrane protease YdiL (CAAX protease family)